jgi:hypothetical protein
MDCGNKKKKGFFFLKKRGQCLKQIKKKLNLQLSARSNCYWNTTKNQTSGRKRLLLGKLNLLSSSKSTKNFRISSKLWTEIIANSKQFETK